MFGAAVGLLAAGAGLPGGAGAGGLPGGAGAGGLPAGADGLLVRAAGLLAGAAGLLADGDADTDGVAADLLVMLMFTVGGAGIVLFSALPSVLLRFAIALKRL